MMLPDLPQSFPASRFPPGTIGFPGTIAASVYADSIVPGLIVPETLSGTIKPNEYATFPVPGLSSLKRG